MKKLMPAFVAFVAFAVSTPLLFAATQAIDIKRVKGAAASPILAGVVVPASANVVYLSGQVPQVADKTKPAESIEAYGDTKTQAISVFAKIKGLLADQGLTLGDVVKLTVYLVGDPKNGGKLDFKGFSEAYAQFFGTTLQPNIVARTTVQVAALANPGFLIEVEATAATLGPIPAPQSIPVPQPKPVK
jgi:2-iminobutanoate/2-iminopropanoate deaminase